MSSRIVAVGKAIAGFFTGSSLWLKILPWALMVGGLLLAFNQYTSRVKVEASLQTEKQWLDRIEKFETDSKERIDALYKRSSALADTATKNTAAQRKATQEALQKILESAPSGSYIEFVDGNCVFNQEFVNSFNRVHNTLPGGSK